MLRQALTGVAFLLLTMLPGAAHTGSPSSPDTVRVVRSPGLSDLPTLDVTIRDGQRVAGLYRDVVGLPAAAPGAYSCPDDLNIVYALTFTSSGRSLLRADVHATGCRFASLQPGGPRTTRDDDTFWDPLAGTLGVPTPNLFPH